MNLIDKNSNSRPKLIKENCYFSFTSSKGVVTDRKGNVIAWIDQAQPTYKKWWGYIKIKLSNIL